MKYLLLQGVNQLIAEVRISGTSADDIFHINHIGAKLKGGGRKALQKLCENADSFGVTLTLNACPMRNSAYPEVWDQTKLLSWYESFGFKRLEPTEFMKHLMVRYARR